MSLHKEINVDDWRVLRVIGGWIYSKVDDGICYNNTSSITSCFVPEPKVNDYEEA